MAKYKTCPACGQTKKCTWKVPPAVGKVCWECYLQYVSRLCPPVSVPSVWIEPWPLTTGTPTIVPPYIITCSTATTHSGSNDNGLKEFAGS